MTSRAMDCNELVELVTEYLEGTLDPETRTRFDEHLTECDGCGNYLEQFQTTIDTLGRVSPDRLDPSFRQRLLEPFGGWQAGPTGE